MRELKFRQWLGNRFEYWGVNVDGCTFVGPCSGGGITASNTPNQQFTGLFDRNGREIYEGDVVVGKEGVIINDPFRASIVFKDGAFEFDRYMGGAEFRPSAIAGNVVVIGNIYENPELLEAK